MRRDPATLALSGALGGWLLATTASQHPHKLFDGLRGFDMTGLVLPNWRFFAPEPAQHDYHVLHRVLDADGEQTPWRETYPITPRKWAHAVFFADRRREKGTFDVANEIITVARQPVAGRHEDRAVRADDQPRAPRSDRGVRGPAAAQGLPVPARPAHRPRRRGRAGLPPQLAVHRAVSVTYGATYARLL